MNKNFIQHINIFLLIILLDQMTKFLFLNNNQFVMNSGMMFGSFSKTTPLIRISLISSGSIIFLIVYLAILYFLSDRLRSLKAGLSLLFGGALSNAIDKVYLNFVVDFIPISFGDYLFHANVSDVFQIIGVVIINYHLFFCQDDIWFPEDKRGRIFIYPKLQIIFAGKFFLISIASLLLISLFSFTYINIEFVDFSASMKVEFISLVLMLSTIFSLLIFIFGILLSHHFYGPIYKLNNFVKNKQWDNDFILREKDQFKQLEEIVVDLKEAINKD